MSSVGPTIRRSHSKTSLTIEKAVIQAVLGERVYIGQGEYQFPLTQTPHYFCPHTTLAYYPICDDFGPMNLGSITRFIDLLEDELYDYPTSPIVYCVETGKRAMTNAIFLLGAYMIVRLHMTVDEVQARFGWLDETYIEPFRDATYAPSDFDLELADCWRALALGLSKGWIAYPSDDSPEMWGMINIDRYEHYDSPLNGDLHEIVPGKLIAFKGPKDTHGPDFVDDRRGFRHFSPAYLARILADLGVSAVVRLNEAEYDWRAFDDGGVLHHDLPFDDCTSPPAEVVRTFLDIVDGAAGAVAVHCKAGLGRTGTLIALYMMRSCGFAPREAIGWLRIMRPGSVIGQQQHFLCRYAEDGPAAAHAAAAAAGGGGGRAGGGRAAAAAAAMGAQEGAHGGGGGGGVPGPAHDERGHPPHGGHPPIAGSASSPAEQAGAAAAASSAADASADASAAAAAAESETLAAQVARGMEMRNALRIHLSTLPLSPSPPSSGHHAPPHPISAEAAAALPSPADAAATPLPAGDAAGVTAGAGAGEGGGGDAQQRRGMLPAGLEVS